MSEVGTVHICAACGTSCEVAEPPEHCPICEDERQYVPTAGQRWVTPTELAAAHGNAWRRPEPDLYELQTQPAFAIGQRAFLIRTPAGNVLWDCIALLDDATIDLVNALGGLAAIAISHPHYYTTCQDWAEAFDAPVYLHERDRRWVMRPHEQLRFWNEDDLPLFPGLTLLRLGGHFPGGTVLHWQGGAEGRGAIMAGDIMQVGADRATVSFLWSYPNWLPLSGVTVGRIGKRLDAVAFDRIYGAFGLHITENAHAAVQRSIDRYCTLLAEPQE